MQLLEMIQTIKLYVLESFYSKEINKMLEKEQNLSWKSIIINLKIWFFACLYSILTIGVVMGIYIFYDKGAALPSVIYITSDLVYQIMIKIRWLC